MREKLLFLLLALLFLTFFDTQAQHNHNHNWCKISMEDAAAIRQQMIISEKEAADRVDTRNAITYVPVRFFLVAQSNGEGRASEESALEALCLLNAAYEPHEIQFYLKEFKYYNNTNVYNQPGSNAGSSAIANQMNNNYNAINIFLVNDAGSGAAAYYQPPAGPTGNDWIVAGVNYADDVRVVAHEVGHFFDLLHPFNGWECTSNGYNAGSHGNPVGFFSPCGVLNEKADGSNCNNAGDFVCDTPADYMFPTANCTFNLSVQDSDGNTLEPDLNNIMNYAFSCDEYYFTPNQVDIINNSLFSSARNYVRPSYTPNTSIVDETPTILNPQSGETIDSYNSVELEWTEVDGADFYLIKMQLPSVGTFFYISESNKILLTDLEPSETYLWQVLAYNEYSTCGNYSTQKILKTGDVFTDTFDIPSVGDWTLQPNPVSGYSTLTVSVDSSSPLTVNINMFTMTGQLVLSYPDQELGAGTSSIDMNLDGIPAGIYLVTLQSENGLETKRVSVQ